MKKRYPGYVIVKMILDDGEHGTWCATRTSPEFYRPGSKAHSADERSARDERGKHYLSSLTRRSGRKCDGHIRPARKLLWASSKCSQKSKKSRSLSRCSGAIRTGRSRFRPDKENIRSFSSYIASGRKKPRFRLYHNKAHRRCNQWREFPVTSSCRSCR